MTTTNDKLRSVVLSAMLVMSVFAGVTAFAGTAAANHDGSGQELANDSETVIFQGQTAVATGYSSGEKVTLYDSNDNYVDQFQADGSGHITIRTSNLEGKYKLGGTSSPDFNFQVVQQSFEVKPDTASVNTETESFNVTIDDTNRAGTFGVDVVSDSDAVEDSTNVSVSEGGEVQVNLTDSPTPGNYTVSLQVNDTSASDSVDLTINEAGSVTASFEQGVISDQRGDIVAIPVNLENTQAANVTIGSEDVNFVADVHVEDAGDGQVTLLLNTARTPGDSDFIQVSTEEEGDSITNGVEYRAGENLQNPLQVGSYDLTVSVPDSSQSPPWRAVNVGSLAINERSTDSAGSYIAPRSTEISSDTSFESLSDVTQRDNVAQGDWQIVSIEASGLYGFLSQEDLDAGVGNNDGVELTFTEQNPGPNQAADSFDASSDGVVVLQDPENNTFYAAINTGSNGVDVESGEWNAQFTVTPESGVVTENESVSTAFSVEQPTADINGGENVRVPTGEANITGTTNLAPGSQFTVQAKSGGNFLKSQQVTVSEDGTYSAPFDFSDANNGTEFTVSLRNTGANLGSVSVSGVVDENAGEAEETTTEETTETTTTETTTTETTTTETTTTETETTTTTTETTTTPAEDGGDGGIPGFGVSVSLVALLAAALLALRRSN